MFAQVIVQEALAIHTPVPASRHRNCGISMGMNKKSIIASPFTDVASVIEKPWTNEEHYRFLEALEAFGHGTTGMEWNHIVKHVQTRTFNEIKLHAHKYFIKLQQATQASSSPVNPLKEDPDIMLPNGESSSWTFTEVLIFENALSRPDGKKWEEVCQLLPSKSSEEIKSRYQQYIKDGGEINDSHQNELVGKQRQTSNILNCADMFDANSLTVECTSGSYICRRYSNEEDENADMGSTSQFSLTDTGTDDVIMVGVLRDNDGENESANLQTEEENDMISI